MKIGIDARFYGLAGPGRYVRNLISHLEELDKKNEYIIFLRGENFSFYTPKNKRFKKVLADYHWYTAAEQIFMPFKIWFARVDLMHFTQFNIPIFWPGKFVVTVHDMIMHEFSTERDSTRSKPVYRLKRLLFLFIFKLACRRALHLLVPSRATKNDLVEKLGVAPEKITVTYEGVDEMFKVKDRRSRPGADLPPAEKIETGVLGKYKIKKPFLLYVGSMYPHKNLERLVKAFKILKDRRAFGGQLVLVGKQSYFSQKLQAFVKRENLSGEIVFPGARVASGYVSDEEVRIFYSQALLCVFPSLKEGFGIPPLEAMSMGLPVAASNSSSVPEVCGQAALYFDPYDPGDIAEKVARLIGDEAARRRLVEAGRERIRRFSWNKMSRQTLAVYCRFLC